MDTRVPPDVMEAIEKRARAEWPDDAEMREWHIGNEVDGYRSVADLDWGPAASMRDAILREAGEFGEDWETRAGFVTEEVAAFNTLAALAPADVPTALLEEWRSAAAREHDWFQQQLEEVESRVVRHRYVAATRAKVEPIRGVLAAMEGIIGAECYNGYIQNYGSWGIWEGEGRSFRYPASFAHGDQVEKRYGRTDDLPAEDLVTGFYRFGANELGIYRALIKIVEMLERDYGLDVSDRHDRR